MTTEASSRTGEGRNGAADVALAALAVFVAVYPAVLFLTGIHVVTLVYGLVPAVGGAVFVAGWVVQRGYPVRRLWRFAIAFVSVAAFGLVAYRLVVEPRLFGEVYGIHFAFDRFRLGVRIAVLGVVTAFAYGLGR